ncbi:hypothetical protein FWJ25_06675 [Marinobacter salinexigens]|uniref:Uncharacterized protein n=1 Tax=Marinobacter salinexigens TaxID=2919747 RepID=A0A5B0VM86_9GAMM|nr:hypothetical protein [Marinobacter salinexigens]KAA1175049.1 hypothetical protein FWJ25_06675 [Marinobacter salinexigens]
MKLNNSGAILQRISFAVGLVVISSSVFSEPRISSVTGELSDGGQLIISGSGFGNFGGRIIAWDDFEQHNIGEYVNGLQSEIGKAWSTQYGYVGPGLAVDGTKSVSGTKSVKIDWSADGGNSIRAFGWSSEGPIDKIYISYHRYMEGAYKAASGYNHKQFYLFGTNSEFPQFMPLIPGGETGWAVYNNSGSFSQVPSGERGYSLQKLSYSNTEGQFQRWEWFLKLNSPETSYNGIVDGWVDGAVNWNFDDFRIGYKSGSFDDFRLGHMAQGFTDSARAWFDDVYTATTPARAEVCFSAEWAACGKEKTVLIPDPDRWGDGQIVVNFRQSNYLSQGKLYLYVIDNNGVVNQSGYQLDAVVGGSLPMPPNPVQVQ